MTTMNNSVIEKRKSSSTDVFNDQFAKKSKSTALTAVNSSVNAIVEHHRGQDSKTPMRTSSLLAPTMLLEGHKGHVYGCEFSPSGQSIASCSFDKHIVLWDTYGECKSYAVLKGHENAIVEVSWSGDGSRIFSASADKTAAIFDAVEGVRIKKIKQHTSFVNTCRPSNQDSPLFATGSDDATAKIFDTRVHNAVSSLDCDYPVLSVAWSRDNQTLFTAGVDHAIRAWDCRKAGQILYQLEAHTDSVTGIRVSPDGNYLLSNSMDNSVRIWDIKAYAPSHRCLKIFLGHQHNFEKNLLRCDWSADGLKIAAGSADRFVYVWDVATRRMLYKLPGHGGSVNQVVFHPTEPIIASCSHDSKLYLGEIAP